MKFRKLTQKGIAHYVAPLAAVVLFAIVGTVLLLRSHAATANYLGFSNYTTASGAPTSTGGSSVFTSQDSLAGIGTQYVSDIIPGGKLYYGSFPGKVYFSQICYMVRVYNSPKAATQVTSAYVTFVGLANKTTRLLPADNNYHQVCVASGTSTTQDIYSIWNQSSSAYVLAFQAVLYY